MSSNRYTFKVRWGDTDAAGIVFYPNFYRWMDEATQELFHSWDVSLHKMFLDKEIAIPVVEAHCEFYSPAFFEDIIEIHSHITEVSNKVFKLEHKIKRKETLLAKGYEIRAWATFGGDRIKAVPIPDRFKKLMINGYLNNDTSKSMTKTQMV